MKKAKFASMPDGAGNHRRDGHGECVAIFHVGEFMADVTPANSSLLTLASNPLVTHTAAWAGLRPVANALGWGFSEIKTFGHGQTGAGQTCFDKAHQIGSAGLIHLTCAIHGQKHLVRVPIGHQVQPGGDHKGLNPHARPAADQSAHLP